MPRTPNKKTSRVRIRKGSEPSDDTPVDGTLVDDTPVDVKKPRKAARRRSSASRVEGAGHLSLRSSPRAVTQHPDAQLKDDRAAFAATFRALRRAYPDAHCELDHGDPFQLVIATVLSAQSTDVAVNQVTPELFRRYPTPEQLSKAKSDTVEGILSRLGMFRQKTKNILGLAKQLVQQHHGQVPQTLEELTALPGVGRKTANVVLGVAFGKPEGVVVDTHVQRISQRLGWTRQTSPEKIEQDLMRLANKRHWDLLSHTLIFHGRRVCSARRPACVSCPVNRRCPSAFKAEQVGRKPPRQRATLTTAKPRSKRATKPG